MEGAELWSEPGTVTCYHPITFGHILGELVRRVTGERIDEFFRREVAEPLGADFHFGLSDPTDQARVATLWFPTLFIGHMLLLAFLWAWWSLFAGAGEDRPNGAFAHRLSVRITMLDIDGTPLLVWKLARAMPIKFKAADLNARAADVGIEEIHLVHEGLSFEAP